ncbi:unnamed protein product [Mytilus edulis]|uniref:Uncharacterized protein n=1 Tax=Mytilus edulis TaxID=6550 RepID=A0A8S3QK29_MYTED|nr:unnamed protein product [Mytilus edulis]
MSEPVLDLNEEDLLRDPLHGQPERLNASNSQANQQNRDLVDTFGLFKDYLDKKLVDLKSDILSEQDNLSKKYRDEANIKFKSEGNRIQFRFNENIMDGLNKIHKDLVSVASPLSSITGDLVACSDFEDCKQDDCVNGGHGHCFEYKCLCLHNPVGHGQ